MCNVYHRAGANKDKIRQYIFSLNKQEVYGHLQWGNAHVTENHRL